MSDRANPTPTSTSDQEPMAGTVKPYERHLAVCTGGPPELWAARVEEMEGLFSELHHALLTRGLAGSVKVTACDALTTSDEGFDIFLMPDMLILPGITSGKLRPLVDALENEFREGLPFDVRPMAGGDHVFVCVHDERDERCGEWGPRFWSALTEAIEGQNAIGHVYRTSHIGGHRFAATCIIYPQGVWYGELRPEDAERVVDEHLNNERLLLDKYRGRIGISSCQQVAEAEAARTLVAAYPQYSSLTIEVDENEETRRAKALARAVVPASSGYMTIRAEFTLSCPATGWTADDEPVFLTYKEA